MATLAEREIARGEKAKAGHPAQSERFTKAAREFGADEDDAAFVEKLKKIAKVKPKGSG